MSNFKFQISNFKFLIILGGAILLRVFLAASTFHPDIRAFNLAGDLVGSGNILNLYDFLASCTLDNPLVKTFGADLFIYPPLIYLLHGVFNFIFSFIFGQNIMNGFIIDQAFFFGNWQFNLHLLLLKIPYFLFDIPAAFLISALFTEPKQKTWAFVLWLFNPVSLYSGYMMGQFDLIPAVLTILALFFVQKKRFYFAALVLGLGAAFKLYPLMLIVPLMLLKKNWLEKAGLLGLALLPYTLTIVPFLPSHGFRAYALTAELTQKTLFAQIPVSGGESLLLFPLILFSFYFYFWYKRALVETLWQRWFVILLTFFIFTHFHPQWLTWLTPFLIIELVHSRFKTLLPLFVLLISYKGMVWLFDPSLTVKIFAPLVPYLYSLPGTWEGLGVHLNEVYFRSLLQTIFASAGIFYIYLYLKNQPEKGD